MNKIALLLVLVISCIVNISLAAYGWRRRKSPGAMAFAFSTILFAVWPFVQIFELITSDLELRILLMKIRMDAPVFGGIAWLVMVVQLIGMEKLVTWRRLAVIASIPVLTMALNMTRFSTIFRHDYYMGQSGIVPILYWTNGFWFWIWFVWSYAVFITPFILLGRSHRNLPHLSRQQVFGILIAFGLPLVVNLLFQASITPVDGFNFTPVTFSISGSVIALTIFRYHLFDVIPVARGLLIDSMTDAVLVLDTQNRVVDANPSMLKMIGKTKNEVMAKNTQSLFDDWPELLEHLGGLSEKHTEITLGGHPPHYFDLRLSPLVNNLGQIYGRLVIIRDITERKQIEDELETSKNNLRRLLESAPDAMLMANRDGTILFVNKQCEVMFGYSRDELLIHQIEILLPENLAEVHKKQRDGYYKNPKNRNMSEDLGLNIIGRRKDGSEFPAEISLSTVESGANILVIASVRDITERKKAEADRIRTELELQSALKHTNILYEITRAAISSNSVETLLEQIAQKIADGLPADRVVLIAIDILEKNIKSFARGGAYSVQIEPSISFDDLMDGLSGWAIKNKRSALSPKGKPDPRESEAVQKRRKETNCGATLVTPLLYQDQILGTITAANQPEEPDFTDSDVELLEAIAAQVTSSMVKISLEENLQNYNKQLSSLHETTLDLLNRRAIDDLLQSIIEQASEFLNVPYCEILLKEGDDLVVKAYTRNQEFLDGDRVRRGEAHLSWQAFDSGLPAVVNDYSSWPLRRDIYSDQHLSAVASIPIVTQGMSIGVLDLSRSQPSKPFDDSDIHAAMLFTQLAAIALDNAHLHENLRQEAIRDPLTGLFNRRFMEETLARELGRASRRSQPLTLVMFDLDNLKEINDTYGHDIGDEVIKHVGSLLMSRIRASDTACRYGGDEFIVIFPEITVSLVQKRMEDFIIELKNLKMTHNDKTIKPVTISVGIAEFPKHGETASELIKSADKALYVSKNKGRNMIKIA